MNKPLRCILALTLIISCGLLFLLTKAQAQTATADQSSAALSATIDTAAAVAQPFIVTFAQQHPWLVTLLALIATARLVFKPIVSAVEAYVRSTPQTTDDEFVDKVTHSRGFKIVAWLLDYLGSIKVGPQFKAQPKPATPTT